MSRFLIGNDTLLEELLRAQRRPPEWVVYRVLYYHAHAYVPDFAPIDATLDMCRHCDLPRAAHNDQATHLRVVSLLMNGPIRHLTVLTRSIDELPKDVRNWLNTLYNLAEAAGTRLDGWIAYDGRG